MDQNTQYVKISISSKLTYIFFAIPIKTPEFFDVNINQLILKFIGNEKGQKKPRHSWRRTVRGLTLPDIKIYYGVIGN